jgi:uncharacterized membrane protein
MFHRRGALAGLLVLTALGCAADPAAPVDHSCDGLPTDELAAAPRATCPDDLPSDADCEGTLPSYKAEVAAVVNERCGTCHGPGGVEVSLPLSTHAQLYQQRRSVLNQIFTCRMPPACAIDLTSDERAMLLKWMVCGSLDN